MTRALISRLSGEAKDSIFSTLSNIYAVLSCAKWNSFGKRFAERLKFCQMCCCTWDILIYHHTLSIFLCYAIASWFVQLRIFLPMGRLRSGLKRIQLFIVVSKLILIGGNDYYWLHPYPCCLRPNEMGYTVKRHVCWMHCVHQKAFAPHHCGLDEIRCESEQNASLQSPFGNTYFSSRPSKCLLIVLFVLISCIIILHVVVDCLSLKSLAFAEHLCCQFHRSDLSLQLACSHPRGPSMICLMTKYVLI